MFKADLAYNTVNLYFQDEARFGLFTQNGKMLTKKGVKPICTFDQKFQSTYLFGAVSPIDGDSFFAQMPTFNTQTFQLFLDEFAKEKQHQFNIIVLDNAPVHKAAQLNIPKNIALIFLPPYAPELNPAEKIWWKFKRAFQNLYCKNLQQVDEFIEQQVFNLERKDIILITAFKYIFANIHWAIF